MCGVDPRGNLVEIDFEVFLDRLNTLGMDVKRIQKIADIGGMLPRLRAQVVGNPVTGEAYLLLDSPQDPPPAMSLGFTPDLPYVPSMPSMFSKVQDRLPELIDRAEETLQDRRGDRQQDSRQPRQERPVLHQRRAHHAGEQHSGAERRLTEVPRPRRACNWTGSPRT